MRAHVSGEDSTASPTTPDGRYFVVRGRLWRCTNPALPKPDREQAVSELMNARRQKGLAMRRGDAIAREEARQAVDRAKHVLGERGPVWWSDGAPDWNRHLAKNTPYAAWFAALDDTSSLEDAKIAGGRRRVHK